MTTEDSNDDAASMGEQLQQRQQELLADVQDGIFEHREQSWRENLRSSLQGWREIGGMSVGAAVAVDLLMAMTGVYVAVTYPSWWWAGVGLAGVGAMGLLEKTGRRVING